MTVAEMAAQLKLEAATTLHDREVEGAIGSDLLSDVLANAAPGFVWVTIQTHRNVAAVAAAQNIAAVIITQGRQPAADTVQLAEAERITILTTSETSFAVCGQLWASGVR